MSVRFLHDSRFFAPVGPVSILHGLLEQHALPRYNLILSHNVVEMKTAFEALVRQTRTGTWLIDNSVIELGKPVDAAMIADAYKIVWGASGQSTREIVCILPDELLDGPATVEVARKALKEFRRKNLTNLMYVPQGKSWQEIVECAEAMQNAEEIRWIGVAKNFVKILGSRIQITQILQSIFPRAKFHMLGFSRNTVDDIASTLLPGVEGIDSSMPLRCTSPISFLSEFPKRGDWWREGIECTPLMRDNVNRVNKWLGS